MHDADREGQEMSVSDEQFGEYTLHRPGSKYHEFTVGNREGKGWVVSYWNDNGECGTVTFRGPESENRARAFLLLMEAEPGELPVE